MQQLNFTPFPGLTTNRLVLRQLDPADANEIFLLRSDDSVNAFIDRPRASSIEDALQFISKINTAIKNNESLYWVISPINETKLAGTICLFNIDQENKKAEIGYELLPSFQGKGIMQEAFAKVVDFVFSTLHLQSIEACVREDNSRSLKLLEKNNFQKDAEAKQKMDDLPENMIVYSLHKK